METLKINRKDWAILFVDYDLSNDKAKSEWAKTLKYVGMEKVMVNTMELVWYISSTQT